MKKILVMVAAVTVAALFSGCGEKEDAHEAAGHENHDSHEKQVHSLSGNVVNEGPVSITPTFVLDNGKKWQLDLPTRTILMQMAGRLERDLSVLAEGDRKQLGDLLRKDLQDLITGCTMQGAAHNELHKYLAVLSPAIEDLASMGGEAQLARVRELLALYPLYFE